MSAQIDFRTLPANVPVLCIPRVYSNISESRIRKIFDDLNMGSIDRIDLVPARNSSEKGDKFNRVFIHFRRWNNSDNANLARERLLNGKEIKIIYDDPWFWKISAYREAERRPAPQQHNSGQRRPTIAFDSDEDRPRRRDDSRERPSRRYDDRPRRRDDSRERPRPRNEDKPKREEERPERKYIEPRTPSNTPPRERPVDESKAINYCNVTIRKRLTKHSVPKNLVIENDIEIENVEEQKENA